MNRHAANISRSNISTLDEDALGFYPLNHSVSSQVWPLANLAVCIPLYVRNPTRFASLRVVHGNTASGNVDGGIYTRDGRLLTSMGSTAMTGSNVARVYPLVNPPVLSHGVYYMAFVLDNTTGGMQSNTIGTTVLTVLGVRQVQNAFPLPAQVSFAPMSVIMCPYIAVHMSPDVTNVIP